MNDAPTLLRHLSEHPLTVLVFFRGNWCPFCQAYLRELDGSFRERLEKDGSRLVAVSSQSAEALEAARDDWGLHYDLVSDPENTLAKKFGASITPKAATPLADDPNEYPNGMSQPAVLVLDSEGQILYRWAIVPSEMNLGGASDRPLPAEIWAAIEAARKGAEPPGPDAKRLDPAFLEANYPALHERFRAWVASQSS